MPEQIHSQEYLTSRTQRAARRVEIRDDFERTTFFVVVIIVLTLFAQMFFSLVFLQEGIFGYFARWVNLFRLISEHPPLAGMFPVGLAILYGGVHFWRHPIPTRYPLPKYPRVPDLRYSDDIYLGSAWTRNGKQPGEVAELGDSMFGPEGVETCHVILKEKGLFGNLHVKGGVGSGKTTTMIEPFTDQAINKYPRPPHPDHFERDGAGRLTRRYTAAAIEELTPPISEEHEEERGMIARALLAQTPYDGMTPTQAEAEYDRLMDLHKRKKWGVFMIDPKGDLTEMVIRSAMLAGREDDVIVLRPDGKYTYNPLVINSNPLVQAEMVMEGIEAVSGQVVQQYWRSQMSDWLANALEILRAADPENINFKRILTMARNEDRRNNLVNAARDARNKSRAEEIRLTGLGKEYTGLRVNPAAIEFFDAWDDPDADQNLKRAVVSGIEGQFKFFVDAEMAPFLCPELPATFPGFYDMIDTGKIVVLRMPLAQYGPVGTVLGILLLADAQQAARQRITRPEMNQERVIAFVVDEISAYLNTLTKDFVAMNRQSRVCFLAAHQSQSQLIKRGDPGFQTSFNDNLRTKISFATPNADSARKEMMMFGGRRVVEETKTEIQTFRGIQRHGWERDPLIEEGSESQGGTVRFDEKDRAWFAPEDFMNLKTGQLVVSEFTGVETLHPRMLVAPPFYALERARIARKLKVDDQTRPPHPVIFVTRENKYLETFNTLLGQCSYLIFEPLFDETGSVRGLKCISDMGTAIVDRDALPESDLQLTFESRVNNDSEKVTVIVTHPDAGARIFADLMSFPDGLLDLLSGFARMHGVDAPSDVHELLDTYYDDALPYDSVDNWDYHQDLDAHRSDLEKASRAIINAFRDLGGYLFEQGDAVRGELAGVMAIRISEEVERRRAEAIAAQEAAEAARAEAAAAADHEGGSEAPEPDDDGPGGSEGPETDEDEDGDDGRAGDGDPSGGWDGPDSAAASAPPSGEPGSFDDDGSDFPFDGDGDLDAEDEDPMFAQMARLREATQASREPEHAPPAPDRFAESSYPIDERDSDPMPEALEDAATEPEIEPLPMDEVRASGSEAPPTCEESPDPSIPGVTHVHGDPEFPARPEARAETEETDPAIQRSGSAGPDRLQGRPADAGDVRSDDSGSDGESSFAPDAFGDLA